MTGTAEHIREFARIKPTVAGPELARFLSAMRRLQDIVVATNPEPSVWNDTATLLEDVCTHLEEHRAPAGVAPAGRPDSRTAYLHVDYRRVTPIDEPLTARAWIDSVDGRKLFLRATMSDSDGNVLSEANGLMIKLLAHQP
ncbi:hypothetical protein H5U41_09035 [Mycolicibacterium holsaticum DSM 44478 = JCM 12374]|nr:hotdog domain-containing protein [Mycolicibacterium holsaticum]QZA15376.1 hypothetical protein K3U96_17795 [Mycolicibacterium holsaticum DSM 44478 = JCM 12374]UNC12351.1 hypothetical protein H5U41_09035 [Mycolicibacterium holsaticum DSM 44478 = JCM 12374]